MSLVLEADSFTHILRIMSTNVDGKRKVSVWSSLCLVVLVLVVCILSVRSVLL